MKPTRRARQATIATAASLAPVAWIYGVTSGVWILSVTLMVALGLAAVVRWKLPASAEARTLGSAFSIVVGIIGTLAFPPVRISNVPDAMPQLLAGAALTALLLAGFRTWLDRPRWGHRASVGIGLLALLSCGAVSQPRGAFALAAAACLVAGAIALRLDDDGRPTLDHMGRRHGLAAAFVVFGSLGFTVSMAEALPRLQRIAENRWFEHMADRQRGSRAGFGVRFQLGDLTSILESDEVALRVIAAPESRPALLRGIVYGRYQYGGHWFLPLSGRAVEIAVPERRPDAPDLVEVQRVAGVPGVFLPVDARDVGTPFGWLSADVTGVLRAAEGESADRVWYRPGPRDRFAPGPPMRDDVRVPGLVQPALDRVLAEWTAGLTTDRERLDEIQRRLLTEFRYSLRSKRLTQVDPTIDFLLNNRVGHCEYFASGMALLARQSGIPARVIGGYRAVEVNGFGNYMVVRERDAHAWVEAWIEGEGWRTYDPTPGDGLTAARGTQSRSGRWDLYAQRWWRLRQAVDLEAVVMAVLGSVLAFLVIRDLWRRRKQRIADSFDADQDERSLRCYEQLAAALSEHGLERGTGETLQRFAARLSESACELESAEPAARWIRSYAALRYGGLGEEAELDMQVRALVDGLARGAPVARDLGLTASGARTDTELPRP